MKVFKKIIVEDVHLNELILLYLSGMQRSYLSRSLLLLVLLLLNLKENNGADSDCNFSQKLEYGKMYLIQNPGFPNKYSGVHSCRWHVISDARVRITCDKFDLPAVSIKTNHSS